MLQWLKTSAFQNIKISVRITNLVLSPFRYKEIKTIDTVLKKKSWTSETKIVRKKFQTAFEQNSIMYNNGVKMYNEIKRTNEGTESITDFKAKLY